MGQQTSMSINNFKKVAVKLPASTSILLRANHGVGKSKVVRQVRALLKELLAATLGRAEFPVIDRRLSQMTEGDMVGLPSTDGEVTRFNPPDWYKKACGEPCVLFLDELNRATPEVMQAAFQIVLDRELNGWKLHPNTRVFSAINTGGTYTINEMDPALLDRFWAIDLCPTPEDFIAWARDTDPVQGGNLHPFIPDFIQSKQDWLYPAKNHEAGSVEPSPRSWEALNHALVGAGIIETPDDPLFYQMCLGFVGIEATVAFRDFCKTIDSQITGEDIVERYNEKKVKSKVARFGQGRQNDLIDKVAAHVVETLDKLNDKQGKNINDFMSQLPDELKISLWGKLTVKGIEKMELAKSIHKHCVKSVLDVFGVPLGEAGVGIVPNIPGIFKQDSDGSKK